MNNTDNSERDAVFENDTIVLTEDGFVKTYISGQKRPFDITYITNAELEEMLDGILSIQTYRAKHGAENERI